MVNKPWCKLVKEAGRFVYGSTMYAEPTAKGVCVRSERTDDNGATLGSIAVDGIIVVDKRLCYNGQDRGLIFCEACDYASKIHGKKR